jgi:hypothetical protein
VSDHLTKLGGRETIFQSAYTGLTAERGNNEAILKMFNDVRARQTHHVRLRFRNVLPHAGLVRHKEGENQMNSIKAISAAVVLSATIAAPAFAQEGYGPYARPGYAAVAPPPIYYRSYGAAPGDYPPTNIDEYRNLQNHGFTGRDPSRVGGESPSLNPSN